MALKNIFVKDTRILISWEERFAKIQLVYNDIVAPYKTIVEHWELFSSMKPYFKSEDASYAVINPSQFSEAMKILDTIKSGYATNKKITFIYDDKVENIISLDTPPENYLVKYKLSASNLVRVLPEKAIECDDNWNVWYNYIWHLPKLSNEELKGFRRDKITKDELVYFLKKDLPQYRDSGLEIDCDIDITDTMASFIEFGQIERDSVELIVNWSVPLDSVDPDFSIFGYVLSNNTVYSGLNPLDIEKYCPELVGSHILHKESIAEFLDNAYEKWAPWIIGDTDKFEEIHHWLKPPYNTFLKIDIETKKGIGWTHAKPYILIGYECLSSQIFKQALSSSYFHLREGWIRAEDLQREIKPQIVENPEDTMKPFDLNPNQILHRGDSYLTDLWDDILFSDSLDWHEEGISPNTAFQHFDFLLKWGIDGGLIGGYEGFMSYGLPYLIEFDKHNDSTKSVIVIDKKYEKVIKSTIENIPLLKDNTDFLYYNYKRIDGVVNKSGYDIAIFVEPESSFTGSDSDTFSPPDELFDIRDSSSISLSFFTTQLNRLPSDPSNPTVRLLGTDVPDDFKYLVRNSINTVEAPRPIAFKKNLHLTQHPLIYHDNELDLK